MAEGIATDTVRNSRVGHQLTAREPLNEASLAKLGILAPHEIAKYNHLHQGADGSMDPDQTTTEDGRVEGEDPLYRFDRVDRLTFGGSQESPFTTAFFHAMFENRRA